MKSAHFLTAAFVGFTLGGLTVLVLWDPAGMSGYPVIFLAPGFITAMAFSRNVHAFNIWIAATGNFAFYSLLTFVCLLFWQRHITSTK
jgi:hypothetical protein